MQVAIRIWEMRCDEMGFRDVFDADVDVYIQSDPINLAAEDFQGRFLVIRLKILVAIRVLISQNGFVTFNAR